MINAKQLIRSLDEYILILGSILNSLHSMANIHHIALLTPDISDDEREQITTAKFHTVSAFAAIRTYLDMVGEHTQIDIAETREKMIKRLEKEIDKSTDSNNNADVHICINENVASGTSPAVHSKKRGRPRKSTECNTSTSAQTGDV